MLWGSDWPHPFPQAGIPRSPLGIEPFKIEDDGKALDRLMRWARTPEIVQKILVENPQRLYVFEQAANADA
jgi:predicted TIM-barrel fold metal-dependent hydrolase